MLTLGKLKVMTPNTLFAEGTANDDPNGLFMANTNRLLRWVAVRGEIHNWCIYCHFAEHDSEWIKRHGDKVIDGKYIKKLVPCDDEAFKMYRY